jgi:flagellum-specific peptidoglycan hydrolase FlgJ
MSHPLSFTLLPPSALKPLNQTGLPVLPTLPPQPVAGNYSRVSSLLGKQDQAQIQPQIQPPGQTALLNPLSLFAAKTPAAPLAPALPARGTHAPSVSPAQPSVGLAELRHKSSVARLQSMSPQELKALGEKDKKAFFEALLPGAIESEKKYGVPAEVTLAQAALESAWARSPIGGYNIFGIKGSGSQGSVNVQTKEFYKGRYVTIRDNFAKYGNFTEAVSKHGALFHNGYYDKAVAQYARDKNPRAFVDNIHGIYATDPKYSQKIKGIIDDYGLTEMVNRTGMV